MFLSNENRLATASKDWPLLRSLSTSAIVLGSFATMTRISTSLGSLKFFGFLVMKSFTSASVTVTPLVTSLYWQRSMMMSFLI